MNNAKHIEGTKVGTYHLAEDTDFNPGQEFAGASQTIRVPAGDYDVVVGTVTDGGRNVMNYSVSMPGVLTHSSWHSSCMSRVEKPMTPATHHMSLYGFQLGAKADEGVVTLDDGWTYAQARRVTQYAHSRLCREYINPKGGGPMRNVWNLWPETSHVSHWLALDGQWV